MTNLRSLRRRDSNSIDAAVRHSAEREAIGNQESLNVVVETTTNSQKDGADNNGVVLHATQDFEANIARLN